MYIGETCDPKTRTTLSLMPNIFMSLGFLCTYTLGSIIPWKLSCYIILVFCIILFLFFLILPETPHWYLLKKREKYALKSLQFFRKDATDEILGQEIDKIKSKINEVGDSVSYFELLKPRSLIPLLVGLFSQAAQQLTGSYIFYVYTSKILLDGNFNTFDLSTSMILVGLTNFLGSFLSISIINYIPKKVTFAVCLLAGGILNYLIASYFSFLESKIFPDYFLLLMIMSIAFVYSIGLRSIPLMILPEIFNTQIRSRAVSLCITFNDLCICTCIQVRKQ